MSVTTETPQKTTPPKQTSLLSPVAYSEMAFPALRLARSSRLARKIGKVLLAMLILAFFLAAVAPWQQSVKGTGSVMAYAPQERQQVLEAPIKGRITRLGDGIVENAHVQAGDLIAEISDIDTEYLVRLEGQLAASKSQVEAAETSLQAGQRSLDAALTVVTAYKDQVEAYEEVKDQTIAAADAAVEGAKNKVEAERQQLLAQRAALSQVQADFDRQETLFKEQIASELKFQEAERKLREAEAKVATAEEYVKAAENNLMEKQSERLAKEQKAQADIEEKTALLRKANADVAKAESDLAKARSDKNKAEKELLDTETKVARQKTQEVRAPFDGFLMQITPNQGSQVLKEGDPIATIVPDTADRAVQIWLDGNDAPLVEPGRHVRLQFEGWPAVQFTGWPSVAVGTFGGEVVSVDAKDDGFGKFRVLVLPDESAGPWPNERYLRQGVRTNGWVLLDQVPLWYEIWRNMNGFPPVVHPDQPKESSKVPKLPKA